jgi:hypothetical protein
MVQGHCVYILYFNLYSFSFLLMCYLLCDQLKTTTKELVEWYTYAQCCTICLHNLGCIILQFGYIASRWNYLACWSFHAVRMIHDSVNTYQTWCPTFLVFSLSFYVFLSSLLEVGCVTKDFVMALQKKKKKVVPGHRV